jgi:hypothetical protein
MNWGKGIIIAMGAFMCFILFMVVTLMSKSTDLESEDYYKKEIEYDQEMNALKNAAQLKEHAKIDLTEEYVVVVLPTKEQVSNVQIALFRPDNKKKDKLLNENNSKTIMIAKNTLLKGRYNVAIKYEVNGKKILQKEEIMID